MYAKSQLLLGLSIIAAIAFVGCIFELSSGLPQLGAVPTWAILVASLPLTVVCFFASVKLAKASIDSPDN